MIYLTYYYNNNAASLSIPLLLITDVPSHVKLDNEVYFSLHININLKYLMNITMMTFCNGNCKFGIRVGIDDVIEQIHNVKHSVAISNDRVSAYIKNLCLYKNLYIYIKTRR